MLISQARTVIEELRSDIVRRGYDAAEKRHFAVLFSDLKYIFSDTRSTKFCPEKRDQVALLEKKWMKDRINTTAGADSITDIIAEIEQFIPDLPAEVKTNVTVIPSQDEAAADRLLAILKQRGVSVSV